MFPSNVKSLRSSPVGRQSRLPDASGAGPDSQKYKRYSYSAVGDEMCLSASEATSRETVSCKQTKSVWPDRVNVIVLIPRNSHLAIRCTGTTSRYVVCIPSALQASNRTSSSTSIRHRTADDLFSRIPHQTAAGSVLLPIATVPRTHTRRAEPWKHHTVRVSNGRNSAPV